MMTSAHRPAPGRFLISEPFMADENFQRTVVLLVEHGAQGSLGFVLNRQLEASLEEVVHGLPPFDANVFLGGPVEQDTLHFVHRRGDLIAESREVLDGLWWGGDFEQIQELIHAGHLQGEEILFFVGYSGWSSGQLDQELRRKSWIVAPENPDFIFRREQDNLWQDILKSMGPRYQVISNYPIDPRLN